MPKPSPSHSNTTSNEYGLDSANRQSAQAAKQAASPWLQRLSWLVGGAWVVNAGALTTRKHLVLDYSTLAGMPENQSWQEILVVHNGILLGLLFLVSLWALAIRLLVSSQPERARLSLGLIVASLLPLFFSLLRSIGYGSSVPPSILEPLWTSFFSGWAVAVLVSTATKHREILPRGWDKSILMGVMLLSAIWFWYQSHTYYRNFMLGFNDFGHFSQRIANTAAGRSFLLETPVLPPFWDHFNPGLLLLVPLWWIWPSVEMIFWLQSFCLASGAWLVAMIARRLGHSRIACTLWGMAWILQPVLSQMNLAFTYGWHPISFAIPFLFLALIAVIDKRNGMALLWTILACSFEEGVIVIVAIWCAARWARKFLSAYLGMKAADSILDGKLQERTWFIGAAVASITFVAVYKLSGLDEFQTARFSDLGSSPLEILTSPLTKPSKFWGQVFQFRTLGFLACLLLPLTPWKLKNSLWIWSVTLLPLGVLIIWQHLPAKSIGFHYSTTLLPVLWVALLAGSTVHRFGAEVLDEKKQMDPLPAALACFTASLVASFYLAALPWSSPTIIDIEYSTYHPDGPRRLATAPDGNWLHEKIEKLRGSSHRVLTTQRIAAHFVGMEEIETVKQLAERRSKLGKFLQTDGSVLPHYDTMVLDRIEGNEETKRATEEIVAEALASGFVVEEEKHSVIVLRNSSKP